MSDDHLPTILTEISEIQSEMPDRGSDYWRNNEKQARLRTLYTRRADLTQPPQAPTILVAIGNEREYLAENGTIEGYDQYLRLNSAAADIHMRLGAEQADFVATFDRLPDEVAYACLLELNQSKGYAGLASGEAIDAFAKLDEGRILLAEWGSQAARNLAIVKHRLQRVLDSLDVSGVAPFCRWLDGLSEAAVIAVYRKLVA